MATILYKTKNGYINMPNITASPTKIVDSLKSEDVNAALSAKQGKTLNESKADKATTLEGYGITDVKIEDGTITIGENSITPLISENEIYIGDPSTAPDSAKIIIEPTSDSTVEVYSKKEINDIVNSLNSDSSILNSRVTTLENSMDSLNTSINNINTAIENILGI